MKTLKTALKGIATAAAISLSAASANAAVIELALVIDSSGSIGSTNYNAQLDAYKNIFQDDFFTNVVTSNDELYVSAWRFSSGVTEAISWTHLTNDTEAAAFGGLFDGGVTTGLSYTSGTTNTAQAITDAANSITSNSIDGDSLIIDISTDGFPNVCGNACGGESAYDAAISAATTANSNGITVNAIGVGDALTNASGQNFLTSLTTAGGGFFVTANNFSTDFEAALRTKLFREINDVEVSEPGTLALFAIGLAGLAATRRKKA
ncbi:hypothetical protein A3715_06645 [Oleiphilus sp. HI0009]|uniref:DUF1194 domain-containing protein n=3 Tax=Oleiphilus TaxID=141450 RepID=UPI0007C37AFD|nr:MULTISPECIES: DUF1194 domain-containing protein [unclassified Oleiphilus]KZX81676.1 hypothetical protein A3715_06645 [Oleiphilus sp. HI0009]KZY68012.1 hypothetical protein A3738_27190 [Oleiphilus sp. HI0066]KZY69586.1 hypothetical protein A3739_08560 [Oleiphilus sp. HI0067]KZY70441.1 hypothetical protein A3738_15255 [Oleiphilus sp. HI0066]KZZ62249.1 hypothetical protein A3762_13530 [Oleiphilus sp. HI0125]